MTVSLRLPEGVYRVDVRSLDDVRWLGEFDAARLAEGVSVPDVPPYRMRTLRAERVR